MQAIRAIYDGRDIIPLEPFKIDKKTEVLIILPDSETKIPPSVAREQLRGAGKGDHLVEKLLASRAEDVNRELKDA